MQKIIFVVDDSGVNLAVAKEALINNFRVMTMLSAVKMFQLMEKVMPDLILLDIQMPEMDGFEAVQCLKNNNKHPDIPVIFLTSTIDASIIERSNQLGSFDIIKKPFSSSELIEKINARLNIDAAE